MNEIIKKRIEGIQNIIVTINHNTHLLGYIYFALQDETINIKNNKSLFWIVNKLIESNVINFSKLIFKEEKHSFSKFLNVCRENNFQMDVKEIEIKIEEFVDLYNDFNVETIRNKYVAHLDLNKKGITIDYSNMERLANNYINIFNKLASELKIKPKINNKEIVDSFDNIFEKIRQIEKIKKLSKVELTKGKSMIEISELIKIMK